MHPGRGKALKTALACAKWASSGAGRGRGTGEIVSLSRNLRVSPDGTGKMQKNEKIICAPENLVYFPVLQERNANPHPATPYVHPIV